METEPFLRMLDIWTKTGSSEWRKFLVKLFFKFVCHAAEGLAAGGGDEYLLWSWFI
jgi:hypothetical protein